MTVFLAACSSVSTKDEPDTGEMVFETNGRLGIKHDDQSDQVQVYWKHGSKGDWVRLEGPLGQTVATLANTPSNTILVTSDKTWEAKDPESLTEEVLGWQLPLTGLRNWILGRPDDVSRSGAFQFSSIDGVSTLEQAGWTIRYLSIDSANNLPKKINLSRESLQIRIVIDEWATGPAFKAIPNQDK
ncbi:lipoprotein insertase outer membrane protein LolB [Leeia sp. TBRC 13508]|uniref:Outer-membrane lipoprotein LolB n=1 Tax=Leeia speluncae TaxID=2884804 RepID=A0ABS8D3D7_9NEIS|nr:lipoprotein insertase outer membrane protein LolB [Leeia speluncae]MCB6182516.1 lipoprotein insertase outer membrane protein LolB [Leeia speluncae]